MKLFIPSSTPLRADKSPNVLWRGDDRGLIQAWEIGRRQAQREPGLALKATAGELPASDLFKGGTASGWRRFNMLPALLLHVVGLERSGLGR